MNETIGYKIIGYKINKERNKRIKKENMNAK